MFRLGALALTIALGAALPAAPALAEPSAHLKVVASFDKEWYLRDSTVHLKISITNDGQLPATQARGFGGGHNLEITSGWDDFVAETVIEPGATRTIDLTARILVSDTVSMSFQGGIFYSTGSGYSTEYLYTWAWIVEGLGDFGGLIYGDANANGTKDSGETGLAGVTVAISGSVASYQKTTDASGRFRFSDIPIGNYWIQYSTVPHSWVVVGLNGSMLDSVTLDETPRHADVRIPAVRSLQNVVSVSMLFDRDTYQAGETVGLTVVLANGGTNELSGITATCVPGPNGEPRLDAGPGWGPLASGGSGVTLPAGQATIVRVTEPVPEAAPRFGYADAYCYFGPPKYPSMARVSTNARVKVPGIPGTGRARLVQDSTGTGVAGVTVALTDPDTGAVVARPVTDADGVLVADGLPAAEYDVRIEGPWKPPPGYIYGSRVPVVAGGSDVRAELRVVPGSPAANLRPNLKVSAVLDKPEYNAGDTMRARLTVTNIGAVAAEGVRANNAGRGPGFPLASWGELDHFGPGARIEAGATRVFEFEGVDWRPQGAVLLSGWLEAAGYDLNWDNNFFAALAIVKATRATYAGVLYGDLDNDGTLDPGEAFVGTPIDLNGGAPHGEYRTSTNERGEFSFPDIPTGRYSPRYHIPDGWRISYGEVVLQEGAAPVEVRAVRESVATPLDASVAFNKPTYVVGEQARITITLTNRGASDLTGITALCSGPGNGNEIYSFGPGWGAIAESGAGVTVRAGRTETFEVWTNIPEGGYEWGYVTLSCFFGIPPDVPTSPFAHAKAKVPGGIGSSGGILVFDRNNDHKDDGDGIPDTKIVLLDDETGAVVARTVTDASGHFMFRDVPAGHYEVLVVGPWKLISCWCWGVFAGKTRDDFHVDVVPGAVQPDPDAPPPPPPADQTPPIEQAAIIATTALAATGVSVVGFLVGALSLLGIGLGLVLIRRRRSV